MEIEKDYIPYGKEWEAQVMKMNKPDIIRIFRQLGEHKIQIEDCLQEYVDFHQRIIDSKMVNPALGSPIKARAKQILNS